MDTDTHADRFEERLLAAILDDFPNISGAGARRGRRERIGSRRRGGLVLLAGATAAAGAVAAIAAGSLGGHAAQVRSSIPAHVSAAYVVDRLKAAVSANANNVIQYVLEHAPNSQTGARENTASWVYGNSAKEVSFSQDLGAGGRPALAYLMTITRHKTVTITINYRSRTWSTTTYPWGSAESRRAPGPKPETTDQAANALRYEVKAGSVTEIGPADVDGQQAIHLVQGSARSGEIDMWVDPATYLPIRTIATAPGVSQASTQAIWDDYKWLPATAANLRLLTPAGAIPAGFTRVSNADD